LRDHDKLSNAKQRRGQRAGAPPRFPPLPLGRLAGGRGEGASWRLPRSCGGARGEKKKQAFRPLTVSQAMSQGGARFPTQGKRRSRLREHAGDDERFTTRRARYDSNDPSATQTKHVMDDSLSLPGRQPGRDTTQVWGGAERLRYLPERQGRTRPYASDDGLDTTQSAMHDSTLYKILQ